MSNNHNNFLLEMNKYMFTLCISGGGIDYNPKLWEALLIGVIPIIKENKPYTDLYINHDLPVVILKDWNDDAITIDKLNEWKNKYYCYFIDSNKRKIMLDKLSLNYWVKYISIL